MSNVQMALHESEQDLKAFNESEQDLLCIIQFQIIILFGLTDNKN